MTATRVDVFLPPPADPAHYREAHPFGPNGGGFDTDLAVEIAPSVAATSPATAVTDGMVGVIPDSPPPGVPVPTTCTLVLVPAWQAASHLRVPVGKSPVVFVYRNLSIASVMDVFTPRIAAAFEGAPISLTGLAELIVRVGRFMGGEFKVAVSAGDALGVAEANGEEGWSRLGFEVVYVHSGLGAHGAWNRLTQIVDPASTRTRRLDPPVFYARVAADPALDLTDNILLDLLSRRVLLEARDEYDLPYTEPLTLTDGFAGTTGSVSIPPASRGILVLDDVPPATTPATATVTVAVADSVLTRLPSGDSASASISESVAAPAHLAFQAIFMADVDSPRNWFVTNPTDPLTGKRLPRFTVGNRVTPLVDGIRTFEDMVAAIRTVDGSSTTSPHFIRLAGWWLTDSFELVPGDSKSTFYELLDDSNVTLVAEVTVLLWDQVGTQNNTEVDNINLLGGYALLDNWTPNFGAHHQKLLVVNGKSGAIGFCGGIDINPDRMVGPDHDVPGKFHDVHAKVEGPAVADLDTTFVQRWNSHPAVKADPLVPRLVPVNPPSAVGTHFTHVSRTFSPSFNSSGTSGFGYDFVPAGEDTGTLRSVLRAISRARRFIYLEDQYATPYAGGLPHSAHPDTLGIRDALRKALDEQGVEYLVIVTTNIPDLPQARYRRHQFIHGLRQDFPGKVFPFYLTTKSEQIWVHTKVWLVDDVYVKIGSANCTRRGFTFETEIDVHVIDGALSNGARRMALDFRQELWGEHLGLRKSGRSLLADPIRALDFWKSPPKDAHIAVYDETADHEPITDDLLWNDFLDPDGR